jgi:hypothetical protein
VESVLWDEGVRRIDTLVVSHADTDHFNAVPDLLDRFAVGEIVVPPPLLGNGSWAVGELLRRARAAGVAVRSMQAGESFALDPFCRIRGLHPPAGGGPGSGDTAARPGGDNETSLVLAVESAGRRLLLTGDIEGAAVARVVAADPGPCDVLVAPHHGSRTSLPPDVALATEPSWVVVSGPGGPGWSDVRRAYAAAVPTGSEHRVVKTGADAESAGGAIAIEMDAAGVRVSQFVAGRWLPLPGDGMRQTAAPSSAAAGSGRVSAHPAAMMASWLTTKPASSMSTPLVKP